MEEEDEDVAEVLLVKRKSSTLPLQTSFHEATSELKRIKTGLMWVFLDQSNVWRACLSWSVFCLLTIVVPLAWHIVFACSSCENLETRPYDGIVQLSLSLFAALSFISLSSFARRYGVRKFLFLDKLGQDNENVRQGYTQQIHMSMKILVAFVVPCFIVDGVYKIWWFCWAGGSEIPYLYNPYFSNIIMCMLVMASWLYRLSISVLVCVLFRLICYLQILRLEDYAQVFEKESDVTYVLLEHLRIRRNLRVISHRFRVFILSTLILVTASQFVSLILTIQIGTRIKTNILNTTGELALCSIILVTGLFICLRSAAKITHKAQSITSLASKWHVCATINTFDTNNIDDVDTTPLGDITPDHKFYSLINNSDEEGDGDDDIDNTKLVGIQTLHSMSYQKRQALVTYFVHNKAGITVYGFMLDRTSLHMIFAIELSLMLWILNKTINNI